MNSSKGLSFAATLSDNVRRVKGVKNPHEFSAIVRSAMRHVVLQKLTFLAKALKCGPNKPFRILVLDPGATEEAFWRTHLVYTENGDPVPEAVEVHGLRLDLHDLDIVRGRRATAPPSEVIPGTKGEKDRQVLWRAHVCLAFDCLYYYSEAKLAATVEKRLLPNGQVWGVIKSILVQGTPEVPGVWREVYEWEGAFEEGEDLVMTAEEGLAYVHCVGEKQMVRYHASTMRPDGSYDHPSPLHWFNNLVVPYGLDNMKAVEIHPDRVIQNCNLLTIQFVERRLDQKKRGKAVHQRPYQKVVKTLPAHGKGAIIDAGVILPGVARVWAQALSCDPSVSKSYEAYVKRGTKLLLPHVNGLYPHEDEIAVRAMKNTLEKSYSTMCAVAPKLVGTNAALDNVHEFNVQRLESLGVPAPLANGLSTFMLSPLNRVDGAVMVVTGTLQLASGLVSCATQAVTSTAQKATNFLKSLVASEQTEGDKGEREELSLLSLATRALTSSAYIRRKALHLWNLLGVTKRLNFARAGSRIVQFLESSPGMFMLSNGSFIMLNSLATAAYEEVSKRWLSRLTGVAYTGSLVFASLEYLSLEVERRCLDTGLLPHMVNSSRDQVMLFLERAVKHAVLEAIPLPVAIAAHAVHNCYVQVGVKWPTRTLREWLNQAVLHAASEDHEYVPMATVTKDLDDSKLLKVHDFLGPVSKDVLDFIGKPELSDSDSNRAWVVKHDLMDQIARPVPGAHSVIGVATERLEVVPQIPHPSVWAEMNWLVRPLLVNNWIFTPLEAEEVIELFLNNSAWPMDKRVKNCKSFIASLNESEPAKISLLSKLDELLKRKADGSVKTRPLIPVNGNGFLQFMLMYPYKNAMANTIEFTCNMREWYQEARRTLISCLTMVDEREGVKDRRWDRILPHVPTNLGMIGGIFRVDTKPGGKYLTETSQEDFSVADFQFRCQGDDCWVGFGNVAVAADLVACDQNCGAFHQESVYADLEACSTNPALVKSIKDIALKEASGRIICRTKDLDEYNMQLQGEIKRGEEHTLTGEPLTSIKASTCWTRAGLVPFGYVSCLGLSDAKSADLYVNIVTTLAKGLGYKLEWEQSRKLDKQDFPMDDDFWPIHEKNRAVLPLECVSYLGGSFLIDENEDRVWATLKVFKCLSYPVDVFPGSAEEQKAAWFHILSRDPDLCVLPLNEWVVNQLFHAELNLSSYNIYLDKALIEQVWAEYQKRHSYMPSTEPDPYRLTWADWEHQLQAQCAKVWTYDEMDEHDLKSMVDEFNAGASWYQPGLNSSVASLYVARFQAEPGYTGD